MTKPNDLRILFLCRDNSARSIMAEAVSNRHGAGKVRAMSAGPRPAAHIHPEIIRTLAAAGYATDGLRPKSWNEFAQADAPLADLVITVCDEVAEETCPSWPGRPARAHWELSNPVRESEAHDDDTYAFRMTLKTLEERVTQFLSRLENQNIVVNDDLARIARLS